MGRREAGSAQAAGEPNPVPRGARDTRKKGGLVEIKPYRGFHVRSFSNNVAADLYELPLENAITNIG